MPWRFGCRVNAGRSRPWRVLVVVVQQGVHVHQDQTINMQSAPGRHSQQFHISPSPYTAPFPVRSTSPPHLLLCMQRPTRMQIECLGACIVTITEALVFEKVPSGPWN